MSIQNFFDWLGQLAAALAVAVPIVIGAFRFLGEKWLENKFAKQLEEQRAAQAQSLEAFKFQANGWLDRATKLHTREFEVLPRAWQMLTESYWRTKGLLSPIRTVLDLDRSSEAEVEEILQKSRLAESEKQRVRDAVAKNDVYDKIETWRRFLAIRTRARKTSVYIMRNGIFMLPHLQAQLKQMDELIWSALSEWSAYREFDDVDTRTQLRESREKLSEMGSEWMNELEAAIQSRLWEEAGALTRTVDSSAPRRPSF